MNKLNAKLLTAAVLSAALVTGCGGGGGGGEAPAPDIAQSVQAALDFIKNLIAGTSETSEPIDIGAITLAVDDIAEPAAL